MKKKTKAFICKMTGNCCKGEGGIVTDLPEQTRLAEFLNIPTEELRSKYLEQRGKKWMMKCDDTDYCIFFNKEKGCLVHPAKPDVCKAWPFFRGNLVDEESWKMSQDYCPGINKDISHAEFVRQGLEYLEKYRLIKDKNTGSANALCVGDLRQ